MADYLEALNGNSSKPSSKGSSDYLAALDSLTPKNTKLQSDTHLSQLDQPTGTFDDQKPSPKLSFLNSFESPQEAYVNEPARKIARAKENAGAIGPQKAFPSGKATLPSPVPSFIADQVPGMQVDVPESVNTFLGGLEGKASQLPVAPGRNLADVNSASDTQLLPLQNAAADVSDRLFGPSYPGAPINLPLADKVGSGLVKGGANLLSGFTSPKALATILAAKGLPEGTAQTGADLYFRKGMAETAADKTETGVAKLFGGDREGGVADLTEALGSGYMAGAGLRREAEPLQEVKQGASPRLNFLRPQEPVAREGTNLQNAAQAEELTVQQQLDQKRAAAKREQMQQPAARGYLDALDSVSPAKESPFKAGDEVPQNATPEQLSAIDKAGFEIGQDGRLAVRAIPPSPRVGEEVPGLDQQAEQLAKNAQNRPISPQGEDAAKVTAAALEQQGAPVAQESTPLQAEVHPKYEQIGIDADSGQPILKQKAERRLDTTERKRVSQMSPEEMQKELLTSESLNLPNKRAFLEEEARNPSPAISMSDADGLKAFNDKFGYEYGNKLLEAKAEALREAGLDAYHEKGDEFLQRDGTPEDLRNKLEKAREILRNKEIEVELNDGTIKRYKGVDFSYGVGKDLSEAEANLKQHKADRESRGERARGELRGITEAGSQAGQVPQGSQLEASPARAEASQPKSSVELSAEDRTKAAEALKRLNDKLGRSHSGVPIDALPDLAEYGYYHFKAGLRDFKEWSAQMVKDLGAKIKPHLRDIFSKYADKLQSEALPLPQPAHNYFRGGSYLDYGFKRDFGGVDMGMSDAYEFRPEADSLSPHQRIQALRQEFDGELESTPDGKLVLYHGTDAARAKRLLAKGAKPGLFLASKAGDDFGAAHYGDTAVRFEVDPRDVAVVDSAGNERPDFVLLKDTKPSRESLPGTANERTQTHPLTPAGSSSRVISDEAFTAAKKSFLDKVTRSSAGVDVSAVKDLAVIGAYHFESGIRTFAEWSKKMVAELGEAVRPHLTKVWNDIQEKVANGEPLPKALARGSAAVAEKPKPLAFLKAPETKQASGNTPPKLPTFLKTESAPEGQPRYAGSINLDKLGVPEEVKRDYEVAYEKAQPEIDAYRRGKISNEKLVSMARDLGLTDKDLAGWKKGGAKNAETLFAAREVVAGARQAARDASNKFLKTHSPEDLLAAQESAAKALLVQTKLSGAASEAGRALNQFRIIAEARKQLGKTNYEKVADSLREKLGDQWNEVAKEVTTRLTQIPETDVVGLNKFLRHFADFTTADKVQAYFITNILSGPPTHERNFVSNQVFGLMQIPDRAVAAAVDAPLAKVFGRDREVYAREVVPAAIGYLTGLPEGLRRAAYIIQHGFDRAEAGKLEVPRNYEFPGGAKNPFNQVSRLLLASDAVNKSMHLHAELRALGTRRAIKEGLKGSKLIDRALELANNPTTEMMDKAITYSRWATFNAKPDAVQRALAGVANLHLGQTGYSGFGANFKPLKFVVPFVGVPYQIGKLGLVDYSPAGLLKLTDKKVRSSGESSFVVARALIGSSILAGLAPLAASGKITGAAPSQPEQRDAFYRAGKQPFSIKIGNRWVAYNQTAGPFANHLAAVAAFHDAFAETGDVPTTKRVMQALGVIGQSELDASFFKGLSNMIDAIREPERSGDSFATSLSQGFVPFSGFLRTATNAKDNIIRDPQTVYERIKTGIPGLSETVAPKVDALGREVRREGGEGALAFLPSRIPKDQPKSGVDSELTRLGVTLSKVGSQISVKNQKFELDKDQQRDLQKLTGNEINRVLVELFSRGNYKALDDEKKALIVDKAIRAVREKARAEYLQKIHESDLKLKPKTRNLPYFLGQPAS